jgi:hypothetical protein
MLGMQQLVVETPSTMGLQIIQQQRKKVCSFLSFTENALSSSDQTV